MDVGGGRGMQGLAFGRTPGCTDLHGSYFHHGGLPLLSPSTHHVDRSLFFDCGWNGIYAKTWTVFAVDGNLALVFVCTYSIIIYC